VASNAREMVQSVAEQLQADHPYVFYFIGIVAVLHILALVYWIITMFTEGGNKKRTKVQ